MQKFQWWLEVPQTRRATSTPILPITAFSWLLVRLIKCFRWIRSYQLICLRRVLLPQLKWHYSGLHPLTLSPCNPHNHYVTKPKHRLCGAKRLNWRGIYGLDIQQFYLLIFLEWSLEFRKCERFVFVFKKSRSVSPVCLYSGMYSRGRQNWWLAWLMSRQISKLWLFKAFYNSQQ